MVFSKATITSREFEQRIADLRIFGFRNSQVKTNDTWVLYFTGMGRSHFYPLWDEIAKELEGQVGVKTAHVNCY